MSKVLTDFALGVRAIAGLPSWRAQQVLLILSEAIISFMALFLIKSGVSEMRTLLLFAVLYLGAGLLVRLHRSGLVPHPLLIPAGLAALTTAGSLATLLSPRPESLALAALGFLTLKDLATSGAVGDVHRAAERIQMPPTRLITTGMLLGALLMIMALWGGGHLLTRSPDIWIGVVTVFALTVLALILRRTIGIKQAKPGVAVPRDVRLTCMLSMIYGGTNFVGKRFLLPIAVAHAALSLGLGADAYTSLGMILSLLVLLGLATRGLSGAAADPRVMMYGGFFCGLALWGVLAALLLVFEMSWTIALISIVLLLVLEITSKIWTLGFIEVLRVKSRETAATDTDNVELAYFGYFMELKCYGASFGFLTAMVALTAQIPAIAPAVALGIVSGIWVYFQTRPTPSIDQDMLTSISAARHKKKAPT
jgi:hypothetical protein